jgi:hypothetical protein
MDAPMSIRSAMLYEMLAATAITATTTAGLLAKQILETPPPLAEQRTEVPTALVTAVEHAMAKSPSARPDGKTFAAELAAARTPDALLPPATVKRKRRWRRIRLMAVIGVTAAIALGFGFWVIVQLFRGFSGGTLPDLSAVGSRAAGISRKHAPTARCRPMSWCATPSSPATPRGTRGCC